MSWREGCGRDGGVFFLVGFFECTKMHLLRSTWSIMFELHNRMAESCALLTGIPLAEIGNGDHIQIFFWLFLSIIITFIVKWTVITFVSFADNTRARLPLLKQRLIMCARARLLGLLQGGNCFY